MSVVLCACAASLQLKMAYEDGRPSCELLAPYSLVFTDVSDVLAASIIRALSTSRQSSYSPPREYEISTRVTDFLTWFLCFFHKYVLRYREQRFAADIYIVL